MKVSKALGNGMAKLLTTDVAICRNDTAILILYLLRASDRAFGFTNNCTALT